MRSIQPVHYDISKLINLRVQIFSEYKNIISKIIFIMLDSVF